MRGSLRCFRCREMGHTADVCPSGGRAQQWVALPLRGGAHTVTRPRAGTPFTVGKLRPRGPHVVGKRQGGAASAGFLLGPRAADLADGDGVYVLELEQGRYYVGKSHCVEERLRQHAEGAGAACAKGYLRRVPPLTPRADDFEAWERAETLARMRRHGIGRVRGWMYTAPELGDAMREHAYQQVCERFDLCRRCGREGHFVSDCAGGGQRPAWAAN
jgi:hypothetical protein